MLLSHTPISQRGYREPDLFTPHASFSNEINRNICRSEIEGGVSLDNLSIGARLEMETKNRLYLLENRGGGQVLISGHPHYCPQPVLVNLHGSTWGTPLMKTRFIGRGMHLEYRHPTRGMIRTSRVREIRERPAHDGPEQVCLRPAG
jgi:hypothetical protein